MYKKSILSNGLRIVSHPIKNRNSVSVGFFIGAGARHESDNVMGAAHFLEHAVFKGSKNYSCDDIKNRVEGVGGMLNAFTGDEETCYYAKIPSRYFEQTFETFADMVYRPRLAPAELKKEKTVIIEEIKMYRDLPQYRVNELLDELMWPGHPMGRSLAGTPESVTAMTRADLSDFHAGHYNGANSVIAVCGYCSHEEVEKLAKRWLKDLPAHRRAASLRADVTQTLPRFSIHSKSIEQTHIAIGFPTYHHDHPMRFAMTLLNVILGGNMSSRLFVEVREKRGLAYSIGSSVKYMHDVGIFNIRAGVENAKAESAVDLILKEIRKIRKFAVPSAEFRRARDYLLGQMLLGLEDTMEHMLWLGESEINRNRIQTLKSVVEQFEKVTPVQVQAAARDVLVSSRFSLAAIGPLDDKARQAFKNVTEVNQF